MTVAANQPAGKQATVITYRSPAGSVDEVVVYRTQEPDLVSERGEPPVVVHRRPGAFPSGRRCGALYRPAAEKASSRPCHRATLANLVPLIRMAVPSGPFATWSIGSLGWRRVDQVVLD